MDRYVTRKPRKDILLPGGCKESKKYRQTTIESMKGVVIIDDILRCKTMLELENQSKEILLETLGELQKKIPSRDALLSTKIGHTVNKTRKHEDPEVSSAAKTLFTNWKKYYKDKNDKPQIEVRSDKDTEKFRKSGRKLLASALSLPESALLPEAIERETFHQHGRRIKNSYRRHIRTLVFTLKHQHDYRTKLSNGETNVVDFVSGFKKS